MKAYQVTTKCYDNGRIVCGIAGIVDTPGFKPASTYRELPLYDLYIDYFWDKKEAEDFVESAKTA